jgi:large subunit ribosomal protein L21e
MEKRVNIRIEHVKHSKCRQEFLDRVKANHDAHVAAREKNGKIEYTTAWQGYSS